MKTSDTKESNDADGEKSCDSTPEPPEIEIAHQCSKTEVGPDVGDVTHNNADAREGADHASDGNHVPGETVASTPIAEVSVNAQ